MVPQGTSTHIISFHPHSNLVSRQSSNPVSQCVDGNPEFREVKRPAQGHTAHRWQSWDSNQTLGDLARAWGGFLSHSVAGPPCPGSALSPRWEAPALPLCLYKASCPSSPSSESFSFRNAFLTAAHSLLSPLNSPSNYCLYHSFSN